MNLEQLRKAYHKTVCAQVLGYRAKIPNIADKDSKRSIELAQGILNRMGFPLCVDFIAMRTGANKGTVQLILAELHDAVMFCGLHEIQCSGT